MAGLLDSIFNTEGGRLGLGLLAAGSARGDGAGFGQRLSEAVGSVDQWKKANAQAEYQKQQQEFQQFQMEQAKAQAMAQMQARQQAGVDDAAVRGAFSPMDGGRAMANGQGPTMANAQNIGQVPQFDPRQFLANNPQASLGALRTAMETNSAINPAPKRESYGPDQTVGEWTPQGFKELFKTGSKPKEIDPNKPFMMVDGKIVPNEAYQAFDLRSKAAGAAKSTTTIDMKGDTEYAKDQGKTYSELMGTINKAGFSAPSQLRKLERMTQLLDGVEGGKLAPMGTEVASALNSFGIKIDPKLGNKEASLALSRELASGLRQPGTGPMTDKDFDNFLLQIPDLSKSGQGRKQITETMQRALARDIEVAKRAREYERKTGRIDGGFMDDLSQYIAENPVIALPQGYGVKR